MAGVSHPTASGRRPDVYQGGRPPKPTAAEPIRLVVSALDPVARAMIIRAVSELGISGQEVSLTALWQTAAHGTVACLDSRAFVSLGRLLCPIVVACEGATFSDEVWLQLMETRRAVIPRGRLGPETEPALI
jgi:hypothetical protein